MAVYKVPQDVEADDKLLGPFSFRQFIYLIVVAISGAGAWGLAQLFIPLAIIPLPFILFFGALALPLRKDQPMEAYLSAIVSFYFLKSRRRFWEPDGIDSFVTIIAPKNSDIKRTKDINEEEAEKRFSYLAGVVDSHGWAVRGQGVESPANLSSDLYYEAQQATDMMDGSTSIAQGIDQKLQTSSTALRQEMVDKMQEPTATRTAAKTTAQPKPAATSVAKAVTDNTATGTAVEEDNPLLPPVPKSPPKPTQGILTSNQRDALTMAKGLAEEAIEERKAAAAKKEAKPAPSTSVTPPSAATIDLATNRPDLTVETISKEARRIEEKAKLPADGEVFISLH